LKLDDKWQAYWKNPGDSGMPPVVAWNLPEGFEAGPLIWPTPTRWDLDSAIGFGYEKDLTLLVQINPPATFTESQAAISADIRWVVCSDTTCLPGEGQVTLSLPVNVDTPKKESAHQEIFTLVRALTPKKPHTATATSKNGLIEISFEDPTNEKRKISHAEYFPEHKKAIDTHTPHLVQQPSGNSKAYAVIVKELSFQASLKGVLVMHTENGKEAYDIDIPIQRHNDSIISMNSAIGAIDDANIDEESPKDTVKNPDSFEFEGGVALAIALAFVGGMILNLMPCVLPVISFKVLGFIKLAGQSRKLIFKHGIAFSAGVLLSFWVLAAALLILQAYGRSVGWGFQLQEPLFVAVLAALLFMFGLSLFGLFEFGTSLMSAAGDAQQKANQRNELLSSFFSGILATAVATPCTGPFLGSAVGYAVTLPPLQAMLIFTSLGLGMSFPYLALAAFPALLRFLPKPGAWMVTFKELMGFLMMASVVWLVWVFSAQTGSFSVSLLLGGFLLFAFACWIFGRWATPLCKRTTRTIGTLASILFFAMGSYVLFISTSPWAEAMDGNAVTKTATDSSQEVADTWEAFSPERVAELRAQGIPVFIDFTAKWCLICQTNHVVLSGEDVTDKFKERGVVKMKADWTKKDEIIASELRKFGRNSVPLYVYYDSEPESPAQILPQVLTPDSVMESLEKK
ncbi:MAG TPA: thioredoxin family protein, partial [Parachlamydiaceae bacterium]|nr:thioredoxin family protein [Parachlamydiaceae bacterium]